MKSHAQISKLLLRVCDKSKEVSQKRDSTCSFILKEYHFMENLTVTIPDSNLAAAVQKALDLGPTDPIPQDKLEELEKLHAEEKGIKDLKGLEKAIGLKVLELQKNQISDIKPISGLTQLTYVEFWDNQISDITPIAGLTQLD